MSFKATRKSRIQLTVKVQAPSEPGIWAGGYMDWSGAGAEGYPVTIVTITYYYVPLREYRMH